MTVASQGAGDSAAGPIAAPFPQKPERFLRLKEVCHRVGLGKSMIYEMIGEKRFPKPYLISPSAARWSEQEVVAWIDEVKDGFEGKRRKF
ncbi:AlpA family phage regulatory protein [Novosphingobium sp. PS1R-30]|uniref:AlpA family phage regulatory protein n=1 Tax=Novosphingobium anseongense TaxID=3133436 RepID=A0ABU8S2B9_9SPHN